MARSLVELADMTQSELLSGFVDTLLKTDEVTAAILANAAITDRPNVKFNRLLAVPTPVYANCDTSFSNQQISGSPVTVDLLTMAVQYNVCDIGQNLFSSFTDTLASETEGALKGLSQKILEGITGSGNGSSAIIGIDSAATQTMTCAVSGAIDVGDLDAMIDLCKTKDESTFFAGSPAVVRKVLAELRSESTLSYQELAGTTMRVPSYMGYPVLKAEGFAAGKLFLVSKAGYQVWLGSSPEMNVGGIFHMQNLGESQTKLEKLFRIYTHIAAANVNPLGLVECGQVI
jgi:hypothetical protein